MIEIEQQSHILVSSWVGWAFVETEDWRKGLGCKRWGYTLMTPGLDLVMYPMHLEEEVLQGAQPVVQVWFDSKEAARGLRVWLMSWCGWCKFQIELLHLS